MSTPVQNPFPPGAADGDNEPRPLPPEMRLDVQEAIRRALGPLPEGSRVGFVAHVEQVGGAVAWSTAVMVRLPKGWSFAAYAAGDTKPGDAAVGAELRFYA